jgi:hypothetical protein
VIGVGRRHERNHNRLVIVCQGGNAASSC